MRRLEVGKIVDYCIEYNEAHGLNDDDKDKANKPQRRQATQADWDAFFG